MATPLKLRDINGNIQELTTAEENYIAYQIGLHLGAGDSAEVGSLNRLTTGTTVGTFSNTFFNQPVGTHPSTSITTGTTNTTIYQTNGTAVETDSDVFSPLMWVDSGSQTGFKMMPDGDLNEAVDRYLTTIFTNEYPGSYRLAPTSPGGDWTVQQTAFVDTRTDGTSTTYNIYKKTSGSAPTTVRPIYVEDSAGGGGIKLREMLDRQIKYSFGQRAKTRIMGSGIGKYQLRSSAAGAPTDPGTWVAKGTATDTKQTTSQQLFTRDSTVNFQANYTKLYTSNYASNYTKLSTVAYQRLYTSNYTKAYTSSYQNEFSLTNYTATYQTGYDNAYQKEFQAGYTGGSYLLTFAGTYTPNYIRRYTGNFNIGYTGTAFNTGFIGPGYVQTYTGNYVPNYLREFVGTFATGFAAPYQGTYTGNYTPNYISTYEGNYARNFAAAYQGNYTGNYVPNYISTYEGNYLRNFNRAYLLTYTGNYVPNYLRNFANTFVGGFVGTSFAAGFVGTSFAGGFVGTTNYVRIFDGAAYVGNYTRQIVPGYVRFYTRNFTAPYTPAARATAYTRLLAYLRTFNRQVILTGYFMSIAGSGTVGPQPHMEASFVRGTNPQIGIGGYSRAVNYTGQLFYLGRARTAYFVAYKFYVQSYTGMLAAAVSDNFFQGIPGTSSYYTGPGSSYIGPGGTYVSDQVYSRPTQGYVGPGAVDYVRAPHDLIVYVSHYTSINYATEVIQQYINRARISATYGTQDGSPSAGGEYIGARYYQWSDYSRSYSGGVNQNYSTAYIKGTPNITFTRISVFMSPWSYAARIADVLNGSIYFNTLTQDGTAGTVQIAVSPNDGYSNPNKFFLGPGYFNIYAPPGETGQISGTNYLGVNKYYGQGYNSYTVELQPGPLAGFYAVNAPQKTNFLNQDYTKDLLSPGVYTGQSYLGGQAQPAPGEYISTGEVQYAGALSPLGFRLVYTGGDGASGGVIYPGLVEPSPGQYGDTTRFTNNLTNAPYTGVYRRILTGYAFVIGQGGILQVGSYGRSIYYTGPAGVIY